MRISINLNDDIKTQFIRGWDYVLKYFPRKVRENDVCSDLLNLLRDCYFRIIEENFKEYAFFEGDFDTLLPTDYIDIIECYLEDELSFTEDMAESIINDIYDNPIFSENLHSVIDDIMTDKHHEWYLQLLIGLVSELLPPIVQIDWIVQKLYKHVRRNRRLSRDDVTIRSIQLKNDLVIVIYTYL